MMDVFVKIEMALQNNKANKILRFGGYYIESKVKKHSHQGMVVKARNNIGKKIAIKFYRPADRDPQILKDGVERFVREVHILASLSHKNIVKVYTGGIARWIEKENRWYVSEGLNEIDLRSDIEVLYYIMDFIEGNDISSIFPELKEEDSNQTEFEEIPIYERLKLFEEMISQVSNAITYYHSKNTTHKDIKPDNIRFSTEDSNFIIVDFGFARHIGSPQDISTIIRTEYLDLESIEEQNYELNDLGQFSRVLLKILPSFKDEYDINRYQGIKNALEKAKHPHLEQRYKNSLEFYNSIRQYFLVLSGWKFSIELNEYLTASQFGRFDRKLRIPVSGSVPLCKEVRRLIDSPEFQRLRGVRQLGPTIFVFPGANHTRFEHSLGTYFLSLKYIEKLMKLPTFRELCEPIDETIKVIVLTSLLHDIGHYPYSHWIEEIDEFPRKIKFLGHEDRARNIICNGNIKKFIEEEWNIDPNIISDIIATKHIEDRKVLINSFINSIIDVDKLDYLIRDSVHCGVNYGKGIDIERVLDALYMDLDTKKICLTDKGRSLLLSILTCRNIMYQEIYWHKTVRACDAMFKRFFYEYINKEIDDVTTLEEYFNYSDDYFIGKLFTGSKNYEDLNELISPFVFKGRSLYKPAYIFFKARTYREPIDTRNFFTKILASSSYKDLVNLSERLANHLKNHIPDLKPLDIIIEKTPIKRDHEKYILNGFKVWNTRKRVFEDYPHEVDTLNQYLENHIQAYIFCNPRHYDGLKELVLKKKLNKILGEL